MSIAKVKEMGRTLSYRTEYVVDNRADVNNLPITDPAGSTCLCCEDFSLWLLTPANTWKEWK